MTLITTRTNDVDIEAVAGLAGAITEDTTKAATTWRSEVTWKGGFRSESTSRDFTPVPSDEPKGLGGTDTAANPVEQILAALGNCLAVGYAANATVLGIELDTLRIEVEGDLDLRTFLGLDPEGHAGFSTIAVKAHIESGATAKELDQLHAAVTSTSPVGHTLQRSIPVDISLA